MACTCVLCPDCNGSGSMWQTLDGEIHTMRCDDMGDLVTCDACRGSGYSEQCDDCFPEDEAFCP